MAPTRLVKVVPRDAQLRALQVLAYLFLSHIHLRPDGRLLPTNPTVSYRLARDKVHKSSIYRGRLCRRAGFLSP